MCSNPESAVNPVEPWWRSSSGYDAGAAVEVGDSVSKKRNEEAKTQGEFVTKEVTQPVLDETYGPEHQHLQHVVSTAPPAGGEYLVPHNPPELVACTPYPYSDPYYGGLMAAYGAQALVNPHLLGVHQARMPLPLEMAEEPVYVNPKQYNGIMRRRQSRAKAELEKKLIKVRKPYLHESRHQHAMRRQRGCGGRFLNTKKLNDEAKPTNEGMEASTTIMQSVSSSAVTTQCTGKSDSSNGQEEIGKGFTKFNTSEQHTYSNNEDGDRRSCYQHQDFRMSAFHPLSGERGEEGDCSGHARGNILARQTSHLALTIQ